MSGADQHRELETIMSAALANGDLEAHYEAECQLEQLHLAAAEQLLAAGHVVEAAAEYSTVARLNFELVNTLRQAIDSGIDDSVGRDQMEQWQVAAQSLALSTTGEAALSRGLASPSDAVTLFGEAEAVFRKLAESDDENGLDVVRADYAMGLREASEGREALLRLDLDGATKILMRARARLEGIVETASAPDAGDELHQLRSRLASDADAVASFYERAAFNSRLFAGDYDAAIAHADASGERLEAALAGLGEQAPAWVVFSMRSQIAQTQSERLRAKAGRYRAEDKWDEARHAYERSRSELLEAAKLILQTRLPQATVSQEMLVSGASLTIGAELRSLATERQLGEELALLRKERDELVQNLRSIGMTVNTYAEASAVAEQQVQLAVRVEQSVRAALGDLGQALQASKLGAEGDATAQELDQLLASKDTPDSFIARAGRLTKRVAEIAKGAGEAAAPLLPVLRILGPLVGVPIP